MFMLLYLFICSFAGSAVLCFLVQVRDPMAVQPLTNWNSGLFSCCDDTKSCKIHGFTKCLREHPKDSLLLQPLYESVNLLLFFFSLSFSPSPQAATASGAAPAWPARLLQALERPDACPYATYAARL